MADEDTSQPPAEPTAPVDPAIAPEAATSELVEVPPAETQTAQIPASEPIGLESAPVDGPLPPEPPPSHEATEGQSEPNAPAPEPPQTAASAPATSATAPTHPVRGLLVKARATIQDRKRKKLEKILEALDGKGPTTLKLRRAGKITNDEVEKLLHVSDATATRYLSALEKQGKIQQVGKTGKAVTYTRI